jgi:hypothetical protein
LFKALYVLSDAAGRVGGPSERSRKRVFDYLKPISHLLPPDIQKQLESETAQLAKEDQT